MADIRNCEQCTASFMPRREHARFCSSRCRVAWNRENRSDPAAEVSALEWSLTAMCDATQSLSRARAWDRPRALAVISEAVWWVTIVDGTLVRHHPDAYDSAMAARGRVQRHLVEETLAGLRFVRNRMGHDVDHVDFIQPAATRPGPGDGRITAWTWKSVRQPELASLSPRGQAWEMTRYHAYEAQLAGHTIGEIFQRAAEFLKLTAASVTSVPDIRARAAR
ncbi:MAG TPA: hypothetical protein VIJ82_33015 [Streptosporangiaceae bacterium]